MNLEVKPRMVIAVVLTIAILVGSYFYIRKTAPEWAYKAEIKKLKLISEHQALEIEVARQRFELAEIKKNIDKNTPTIELAPAKSQEGK